jgi:hypothetical protein
MISCVCPGCGKTFRAKDDSLGKKAKCGKCGSLFLVTETWKDQQGPVSRIEADGASNRRATIERVESEDANSQLDQNTRSVPESRGRGLATRRILLLAAAGLLVLTFALAAFWLRSARAPVALSTANDGSSPSVPVVANVVAKQEGASSDNPNHANSPSKPAADDKSSSSPPTGNSAKADRPTGIDAAIDALSGDFPPRSGKLALIEFQKAMRDKALSYPRGFVNRYSVGNDIREFVASLSEAERKQTYVLRDLDAAVVRPAAQLTWGTMPADVTWLSNAASVPDETEVYVRSFIPLRLSNPGFAYQDPYMQGVSKYPALFSLCKADVMRSLPWFMTKEKTLSPCHNLQEVSLVLRSGGFLYLPQSSVETMVFVVSAFDNTIKRQLRERARLRMDVVFDDVQWQAPTEVGLYKLNALLKARCNSDELDNWNRAGGILSEQPNFFRPDDAVPAPTASAQLVAIFLRDESQNVLATFRLPNDKRALEFPPVETPPPQPAIVGDAAKAQTNTPRAAAVMRPTPSVWPSQPAEGTGKKTSKTHARNGRGKTDVDRDELLRQFLSTVAGQWRLESKNGDAVSSETLRIDNKGNWFTNKDGHEKLTFIMQEIHYDPDSRTVRFIKAPSASSGEKTPRHVEILSLGKTTSTMTGHVQNGRTKLSYARVEN